MAIDESLARRRLAARQAELTELSDMTAEDRAAVALDQQSVGRLSRMDAMQQQAMSQAQQRARSAELVRIDQALRRLEDGEYGYCLECGDEIPDKRLEIDPSASHCVKCAKG
jgi:DnaK suppressor protein